METSIDNTWCLAFETSTAVGSVALGRGDGVLEVRALAEQRQHATQFMPAVADLCGRHGAAPAQIGIVFVSSGPGSFTGLRIGVTAARMIALATGARLVAVPTLEVIAQNALDIPEATECPQRVVPVLDAKRGRVYTATFERRDEKYEAVTAPVEAGPGEYIASVIAAGEPCAVLGEGVLYHRAAIQRTGVPILPESLYPPRPEVVYRLGRQRAQRSEFIDRRNLVPTYVRPPEAEEKWRARHEA